MQSVTTAWKWRDGGFTEAKDWLAIEEPLEIQLAVGEAPPTSISITMRTPGDDVALALGFLYAEGIIAAPEAVVAVAETTGDNIVRITLDPRHVGDLSRLARGFAQHSSCGVCGKTSLAALHQVGRKVCDATTTVRASTLLALPDVLRSNQRTFATTGGVHAVGLFGDDGAFKRCAEDVGRHNAFDKVLGATFQAGELPWRDHIVVLSGRASFELLQKAIAAGVPIVAAVGAPSSLAVELAEAFGVTLVGFLRAATFNVHTHAQRIVAG